MMSFGLYQVFQSAKANMALTILGVILGKITGMYPGLNLRLRNGSKYWIRGCDHAQYDQRSRGFHTNNERY
jgi:hypothetical protein